MNRMKKTFIWAFMMNKRLYKKVSFIVIIALIPLLTLSMTLLSREDSGILKIAVCAENWEDEVASDIVEDLLEAPGVILFKKVSSVDEAKDKVETGQVDATWIFHDELNEKIEDFVKGESGKGFVTVIEREENVSLQLSHEKLYDAVYPYISYYVYNDFVNSQLFPGEVLDEEQIEEIYQEASDGKSLIIYERLDMGAVELGDGEYLVAPLRGLLSLVILLCGIAAVMYYFRDSERGMYDWLPEHRRLIPAFGISFVAVINGAVAVLIALVISGINTLLVKELISMAVYIIAVVMFCLFVGTLCGKSSLIGQITPFVMLLALVLSPIFFLMGNLQWLQMILPTYYYIYGVNDYLYLLYGLIYSLILFFLTIILNRIKRIC